MQADLSKDYFELFGLPTAFDLDPNDLSARYRQLQRQFHPDRFASAPAAERRLSVQMTAQINAAFQTLKDPVARARYLLGLHGLDTGEETDTAMNPAFLMEQMELREALAETGNSSSREQEIESLRQRVEQQFDSRTVLLSQQLAENSEPARRQARNLVRELQFLQKMTQEIQELD